MKKPIKLTTHRNHTAYLYPLPRNPLIEVVRDSDDVIVKEYRLKSHDNDFCLCSMSGVELFRSSELEVISKFAIDYIFDKFLSHCNKWLSMLNDGHTVKSIAELEGLPEKKVLSLIKQWTN